MTPHEFVKKWLTDYNEKYNDWLQKGQLQSAKDYIFENKYFQEAYENAMKAQREICADVYRDSLGDAYKAAHILIDDKILNAPMP
ncbi:MAG: hypothetical protein FWC41_07255 [Firmicutes bacterium]|nr:hypothetical protein [Bacillota bacterium]